VSSIGKLKIIKNNQGQVFAKGLFATLIVSLTIRLDPVIEQHGDDGPTHDVIALVGNRGVPVGAAWLKTLKQGRDKGKLFFNMTLDDPSFSEPLNLAAFPTSEPDVYAIVWKRKRDIPGSQAVADQLHAETAAGAAQREGGQLDDAVPL